MNTYDDPASVIESPTKSVAEVQICSPGHLRAQRNPPNTALLTWDEPYATCHLCPNAIGYEVYGEGITTQHVARPPCEITGLQTHIEYLIYVTAKASGNNVSTPSPYRFFKTKPNSPGTPQISNITSSSATLTWTPSTDSGEIKRYRVYLNGFLVGLTKETSLNLNHLKSTFGFLVQVCAVNEQGASDPAWATFWTLLAPPKNLRLRHNSGTCRLTWHPLFLVAPTYEGTINGRPFTAGPLGFNFNLAEFSPGPVPHQFHFTVFAKLGEQVSETTTFTTTLDDLIPPTQPGKPVVSQITHDSAQLSWAPASDNTGVTGYRVVVNGFRVTTTADTHYLYKTSSSDNYKCVYIRAEDKDGNLSIPSERTVFRTTGRVSESLPSPEATITPLTSTTARLDWSLAEGGGLPVGVMIMIDGSHYETTMISNSAVMRNLLPGMEYVIELFAFGPLGSMSEPTVIHHEQNYITPPGSPENLRKVESSFDSVTLGWGMSDDEAGILEYVIYSNHEYFDSTPLATYTAVNLLPGTYAFEVCAMDVSGNVSEPATVSVVIDDPAASALS
ncbi:fibronectin type III domain-containing protein [Pseudomonas sp. PB120]|uniref:fibronectin type III domain-containing protein n=1 Tax=Pseudomonas sp. PB120 TaxID=2494700 RepID=UPI0012FE732B|nr:fibronectin type III domain-containing protein [Pseudomonas sp. PB120]